MSLCFFPLMDIRPIGEADAALFARSDGEAFLGETGGRAVSVTHAP